MQLTVNKYVAGSQANVPSQVGGGETVLAVHGIMDAIDATETLFSEGGPDTVYRSALQAISSLKKIVKDSRDKLDEADLRLQILEKKVMAL